MTVRWKSLRLAANALAGASALCTPVQIQAQRSAAPFENAMARIARDGPMIPGVIVAVSSPRLGLEWQSAIGTTTLHGHEPLKASDAFRIASITKVYTAATVFRAIELKKFRLYDSIRPLISLESAAILSKAGYDLDAITVVQLLNHTSGIYDFATDKNWGKTIMVSPRRNWTRHEQIVYAVEHGHKYSEPGAEYHYSDTGYSLLSEIVERSTGMPLPKAAATLIDYRKLGLARTHFEKLEPAPAGERRAHQYVGDGDVNGLDASIDLYGAGGIVTTAADLAHFIRPLLLGQVFKDPTTLPAGLILPQVANPDGTDHAALLERIKLGKRICWGHGGYWGVLVAYCPDVDLAVAISTNQNIFGPKAPDHSISHRVVEAAIGDAIDEVARAAKPRL